jgi:uracil-DNA glycosylase family 4
MDPVPASLSELAHSISSCTLCRLCEGRTHTVPGIGHPHAQIVFIGEAPGKKEDEQGIPFCGASGKFLDELLATIDLNREDIFITNIVKCRPPANRDPLPDEKEICSRTHLDKQIELINPKLIVTLGRHALWHFIPDLKISEVHGKPQEHNNQVYLALYHPAVALYNGGMRKTLIEDFQNIPKTLTALKAQTK